MKIKFIYLFLTSLTLGCFSFIHSQKIIEPKKINDNQINLDGIINKEEWKNASKVSLERYKKLALMIRQTLRKAIRAGGTTLQDFQSLDETPGYFTVSLKVYGRQNEPCLGCKKPIIQIKQAGRSTWYCSVCQN